MAKESIEKKGKTAANYRERHALLNTNIPLRAFVKETLPIRLKINYKDIVVYPKALTLHRNFSQEFWQDTTNKPKLTEAEKRDFQVVLVPTTHLNKNKKNKDFTNKFYSEFKNDQLGKHPVARYVGGESYSGDPNEAAKNIKDFKKVKSVYIIASPLNDEDYANIQATALQYLMNGAKEVILIAPFMADEREDKNVKKLKNGKYKYNGRIIKIARDMKGLGPFVNRIITFEPHSSATQAFAALAGIALAPISLEEELIGEIKEVLDKVDKEEWRVVRPDKGRNLVTTRIEKFFGIKGSHISQIRNANTLNKQAELLTTKEKAELQNKNIILYDDEGGTLGTIKNVVLDHLLPSNVKSINIFLGHSRLQRGWERNLQKMINKARKKSISIKIYMTDSRIPVGDLKTFMKNNPGTIKIVSVATKIKNIIEATVKDVDFWTETSFKGINYERAILQFTRKFDNGNNLDDNG